MKHVMFRIGMLAFLLLGFSLCSQSTPEQEQAKEEVREAADAVSDAAQAEKDSLAIELKVMLEKVDRKLDQLNDRLKTTSGKARTDIQVQIKGLEKTRKELADDLEHFNDHLGDAWHDFSVGARAKIQKWNRELADSFDSKLE